MFALLALAPIAGGAMNKGPLALIGMAVLGALAFFLGEDEASAKPGNKGGPYIDANDALGLKEAEEMAGVINGAVATCGDVMAGEYCDTAKLKTAAEYLKNHPWKHPVVKETAKAEAEKLLGVASDADELQLNFEQEAQQYVTWAQAGNCDQPTKACVSRLYQYANKLDSYKWTSPAGIKAHETAAGFRAKAKAIEDYIAAQGAG